MRKGKAMLSVALAAAMTLGSAVPALADGDKTKVVFMSRDSGDTPIAKVYEDQIARFMEENPDIEVQNDSVYEEAAYNNKLKVALSTGETPILSGNRRSDRVGAEWCSFGSYRFPGCRSGMEGLFPGWSIGHL